MHSPEITSYIDAIDVNWQREAFEKIRRTIHQADPDIEEALKWGSPTFYHNGPVLWVFAAKEWVHISFPHGALLGNNHGLFEETDSKGQRTIKLREKDTFPREILLDLLKEAVQNNIEGKRISFSTTKPGSKTYDLSEKYKKILNENKLLEQFTKRPYYQQSGWIRWIESAKRPKTQERRQQQMLEELIAGDVYMKMPW